MNSLTHRPKVLITKPIPDVAKNLLEQYYEVLIWDKDETTSESKLIEMASDCHGILTMLSNKIDKDFIDACPHLKIIANYAVGFNNIDVKYASSKNIIVSNTPDVLTEATAELTLALLLAASRRILESYQSIGRGEWKTWEPLGFLGPSLKGKTLGVIGMGRIGYAFAHKCHRAFDMPIIYHSRSSHHQDAEKNLNATRFPFDDVLSRSDVISLHCPLNAESMNLFDRNAFLKMKKGSIFLNTARGEMHNENDLYEVLKNGHLFSAGLDVTNPEPMRNNSPLLGLQNIVITPHIGSATIEARDQMATLAAKNIHHVLMNESPLTPVNT